MGATDRQITGMVPYTLLFRNQDLGYKVQEAPPFSIFSYSTNATNLLQKHIQEARQISSTQFQGDHDSTKENASVGFAIILGYAGY